MKKTLSALLAAVLLIGAVFALASCGSKGEGIVGKWKATISFDKAIAAAGEEAAQAMSALGADLSGYSVDLNVEFKDNGKYVATVDEDQVKSVMKEMMGGLIENLVSSMGMSMDDYLQQAGYSSIDDAVDAALEQSEESGIGGTKEGEYKLEGDKLTLGENVIKVELSGDKLSFVEIESGEDNELIAKAMLPLDFIRQ